MSEKQVTEIVFVVDVTSFTERGFVGTSTYEGAPLEIEFDDSDAGVRLTPEMCKRLGVRKGSGVVIVGEDDDKPQVAESVVYSTGDRVRISNARIYYFVGRSGGAVIRIRRRD